MRVQVYLTESHPHRSQLVQHDDGPARMDEGTIRPNPSFSHVTGRIIDTVHPLTQEPITRDEIAAALLADAERKFPAPDYEVRLERYVEHDEAVIDPATGEQAVDEAGVPVTDKAGEWVTDAPGVESAPPGEVLEREVSIEQATATEASV